MDLKTFTYLIFNQDLMCLSRALNIGLDTTNSIIDIEIDKRLAKLK
jgi:hypothetical protein